MINRWGLVCQGKALYILYKSTDLIWLDEDFWFLSVVLLLPLLCKTDSKVTDWSQPHETQQINSVLFMDLSRASHDTT